MFTADAHADTLYARAIDKKAAGECAVRPERLREGGVGLQVFALFAGPDGPAGAPYRDGLAMMADAENLGVPLLRGALPADPPAEPMGAISIEGGEMLEGRIDRLHEFHAMARIRMIALTWNHENEIGHPSRGDTGMPLKPFGRELICEMDRLGILVDASHLNDAGFFDAAERSSLPVIASHSNFKPLCPSNRNLTPDQVKVIIEKRGFIGINFYSRFLAQDRPAELEDVLRHIDGICELGGEHVLGFGSDFDGIDAWPEGLASPADFPALIELLLRRGYSQAHVEGFVGLNLWRVLKRAEAAARA